MRHAPVLLEVRPEMFGSKAPATPQVFIDAALNVPPEATNFDFDAFYDLARTAEYTPDEIVTYRQVYAGEGGSRSYGGRHDGRTATIFVPRVVRNAAALAKRSRRSIMRQYGADIYNDTSVSAIINEVSIHEFGHDHDTLHGHADRNVRVARASHYTGLAVGLALVGDVLAEPASPHTLLDMTGVLVLAGVAVGWRLTHMAEASTAIERPAYQFQEQHQGVTIVNFDPTAFA